MMAQIVQLPLWETMRFLGVVSYIMITIGLCVGIFYGVNYRHPQTKLKVYKVHNFFTIGGSAIGLLHGVITVIDTYTPYTWSDVLIPFTADFKPVLSGIGTIAMYILLVVILTTDLRHKIKRSVWIGLHLLAYPAFFMTLIHGFFMGTDSSAFYMQVIYITSVFAVVFSVFARGILVKE